MFVLSNYVCQNNLHVQILNDSVINAKHNFAADDEWYHINIINFFTLLLSFRFLLDTEIQLFQIQSLGCNFQQGILKAFYKLFST